MARTRRLHSDRRLLAVADRQHRNPQQQVTPEHRIGHLDDDTPSLALAVREPFRSNGIGSALLQAMLLLLKQAGYPRVSLSVQKANRAVHLYRRAGFHPVRETAEEFLMVAELP